MSGRVLRWLVGIATLAAVIVAVTRITEPRDFLRVLEHAAPWWMAVGLALQGGTYIAQAMVWRTVAGAAREPLALASAVRIALAKLFVDQTLPSGGISGGVLLVGALGKRGLTEPTTSATLVVGLVGYYLAYAIGLAVAVAVAVTTEHVTMLVLVASLVFIAVALGIAAGVIALAHARHLPHVRVLHRLTRWLARADRRITRDASVFARATAYQLAIIALDGATLWAMLRAVGTTAPVAGVFASFMLASLARTLAITPGGLGVFEGAGVLALVHIGVHHAEALSATLLFRGLSYWLPMIPGVLASHGLRERDR